MTESWFQHRAVHVNADGSRDLGLAQASDYARAMTARLYGVGLCTFQMADRDYFNPWRATRWLVYWFGLMLDEAHGDLDRAIRSYNVGGGRARSDGDAYLAVVEARRARYFEGPSGSPTWQWLSAVRRRGGVTTAEAGLAGAPAETRMASTARPISRPRAASAGSGPGSSADPTTRPGSPSGR